MEHQRQIENIKKQEETLDKIETLLNQLTPLIEEWEIIQPDFRDLMDYYGSSQWLEDVEISNKGTFKHIKCGVLSEDAIYNLYSDQRALNFKIMRTALNYLEK